MAREGLDLQTEERIRDCGRRFAMRLSRAVVSMRTFDLDHQSMHWAIDGVADALSELERLVGDAVVEVEVDAVSPSGLRVELEGAAHKNLRDLYRYLSRRDARAVRVQGQVSSDDVRQFLRALDEAGSRAPSEAREAVNRALDEAGITHLRVEAGAAGAPAQEADDVAEPHVRLLRAWLEVARLAEDALGDGARTGTLQALEDVLPALIELACARPATALHLVEQAPAVPYEARHVANTTLLAVLLGQRLGLDRELLLDLASAVVGMDLGMTVLPVEIRRAPRELTDAELATLETHPLESVRVHLRERVLDANVRRRIMVAMEQHLGRDRDGYPQVEHWPRLHLFSRIGAVVDAYDALTSDSPWRRGLPPAQALAQLRPPTDKSHDPVVVAELCALLGHYPSRCPVVLSTGERAVVVQERGTGGLPVVETDDGERLQIGAPADESGQPVAIVEICIDREAARAG